MMRKINILIVAITLSMVIYVVILWHTNFNNQIVFDETMLEAIPDIMDNEPPKGKSIFFVETSYIQAIPLNGTFSISPRQACALESAAKVHPNLTVYLLYSITSDKMNRSLYFEKNDRIINALHKYQNIRIRSVDTNRYTQDTPLNNWSIRKNMDKSNFPIEHASDVMRYLTLWKYGGTYLDLDVIVLKNLEELGTDYVAMESQENVGSSVLNFDHKGIGQEVANICINDLRENFNGKVWANNGPGVITRAMKNICQGKLEMNSKCKGFNLLSLSYFFPIPWENWSLYFDPDKVELAMDKIKSSYGVHVWNKLSKNMKTYTNQTNVLYSIIAKEKCPNVFKESGEYF